MLPLPHLPNPYIHDQIHVSEELPRVQYQVDHMLPPSSILVEPSHIRERERETYLTPPLESVHTQASSPQPPRFFLTRFAYTVSDAHLSLVSMFLSSISLSLTHIHPPPPTLTHSPSLSLSVSMHVLRRVVVEVVVLSTTHLE